MRLIQPRCENSEDAIKRDSDDGKKPAKQIVFEGKRFDVMSVRRWRDSALS